MVIPCLCLFVALSSLFSELVGAKPLHLLTQTVLLLAQTQTSDKQKTYPNPFPKSVKARTAPWAVPRCDEDVRRTYSFQCSSSSAGYAFVQ